MAALLSPVASALPAVAATYSFARQVRADVRGDRLDREREEARRQRDNHERAAFEHSQALERLQLDQRQRAETAAREAEHGARARQIQAEGEAAERRRSEALRRSAARTRSLLGSTGIGSAEGSGAAILAGMARQAETERGEALDAARLRRQSLDRELAQFRHRNLLESSDLAERQRLERYGRGYV